MSTFWRSEYERLIEQHHAEGHVLPGTKNCLDDAYLGPAFWRTAERAAEEARQYGGTEFGAEVRELAGLHRAEMGRQYVSQVLGRHRAKVERRHQLDVRRMRLRLRMALHEMDEVLGR